MILFRLLYLPHITTLSRLRHHLSIGVGRFRILAPQYLKYWGGGGGGQGGPNSQQAYDVVTTSMRRNDVASTSFRRHVPTKFLINQCQIIAFLILKFYNIIIQNSRIELKGIVLPVPSNQIKVYYYFTLQLGTVVIFFLFHIEIEGKCGWIIGGGGVKGYVGLPLSNYWGILPRPPPLPTPMLC